MALPYANPGSYQQWASDLIAGSGGQLPNTPAEVTLISGWEQSENPVNQVGSYTSHGGFNALNTSLTTGSSGLEPGSTFIPTFPTIDAAISATLSTLRQQNFAPELSALENQSGSALVSALGSPGHVWGSSPSLVAQILGEGPSTASTGSGGGPSSGGAGTPTATLTALPGGNWDPLNWPGAIAGAGGSAVASGLMGVIRTITDPLKNFVEDAGLVILGVFLFAIGMLIIAHSVSSGGGTETSSTTSSSDTEEEGAEEEEPEEHEDEHEEEPREEHTETHTTETVHEPRQDREGQREGAAMEHEAEEAPAAVAAAA